MLSLAFSCMQGREMRAYTQSAVEVPSVIFFLFIFQSTRQTDFMT